MNNISDLEINIELAKAMGWEFYSKENPPIKKNVGISVTQAGLFAWDEVQYKWRKFDYRDPVIFVAICKRWMLVVNFEGWVWASHSDGIEVAGNWCRECIEKAAALTVIDAVNRGAK